ITKLAKAGTMLVETPELTTALLHSADRTAWRAIPTRPVATSGLSLSAALTSPGYFVATTTLPELAATSAGSAGSHTSAILLAVAIAVVALALFATAFVIVRRRGR